MTVAETTKNLSPGSVVRIRNRLWRVDGIGHNVLTASTIDGGESEQRRFFLPAEKVTTDSIPMPSPDKVGHPANHELLVRAYRISLMHGTAPFLSLQRSRVIPTNYQLVPVVMALDLPKVRMLIADDVGLGKTIEAGLIISELMARQMAHRLLVVCPANLREQWQDALYYFFHIHARIISGTHRREMERELPAGANPWEFYNSLIVSVDYAKTPTIRNQIIEQPWDIVVIDEAHQVAKPHQTQKRQKVDMERHEFGKAVAETAKHLLLLTATPHNGYKDSYASLLRMLGEDLVRGEEAEPKLYRNRAKKYICQRRRKDVEEWFKEGGLEESPFPERDQEEIIIQHISPEWKVAIDAVEEYGNRIIEGAKKERKGSIMAKWLVMHVHKRALSSPRALIKSLLNRRDKLLKRYSPDADEQEQMVPREVAQANALDTDVGETLSDEEAGKRIEHLVVGSPENVKQELGIIPNLIELARKITPAKDTKLQELLQTQLKERLRTYPKVIIFTKYRDTLEYLESEINKHSDYQKVEVITLYGELNEAGRRERFHDFAKSKKAVMIATDCISEGINLQHAAAQLIHYELPWNPNRLEQRNGRVDRYGQMHRDKDGKRRVYIRTLAMDETLEAKILKVILKKAIQIRRDYGFAPPYLEDPEAIFDIIKKQGIEFENKEPEQYVLVLAGQEGDEEEILGSPYYGNDEESHRKMMDINGASFYGQTDVGLDDIRKRLHHSQELIGSPKEIEDFVIQGLRRYGCKIEKNKDETYSIDIYDPKLQTGTVGNVIKAATFDPRVGLGDPEVDILDVGHPLVRRLIDVIKTRAFLGDEHYGRTSIYTSPSVKETIAVLHVLVRYAVNTKTKGILEEIVSVAYPVYGEIRLKPEEAFQLLKTRRTAERRTATEISEALRDALGHKRLAAFIQDTVSIRLKDICKERQALKQRLSEDISEGERIWLEGIDEVSMASTDILSALVIFPVVK